MMNAHYIVVGDGEVTHTYEDEVYAMEKKKKKQEKSIFFSFWCRRTIFAIILRKIDLSWASTY